VYCRSATEGEWDGWISGGPLHMDTVHGGGPGCLLKQVCAVSHKLGTPRRDGHRLVPCLSANVAIFAQAHKMSDSDVYFRKPKNLRIGQYSPQAKPTVIDLSSLLNLSSSTLNDNDTEQNMIMMAKMMKFMIMMKTF
jgi:hypothetical protein